MGTIYTRTLEQIAELIAQIDDESGKRMVLIVGKTQREASETLKFITRAMGRERMQGATRNAARLTGGTTIKALNTDHLRGYAPPRLVVTLPGVHLNHVTPLRAPTLAAAPQ